MALQSIPYRPGVFRDSSRTASGLYATNSDKIRWVDSRPQAMGGWLSAADQTVRGIARGLFNWFSNAGTPYTAIGSSSALQILSDRRLWGVTPIRSSPTLVNPFSTTIGLSTVSVAATSHGLSTGARVYFGTATAVGGVTVGGASGTFSADPFSVYAGSTEVFVRHVGHGAATDDRVDISGGTAVGGLTLSGKYIINVIDADSYLINASAPATSTATGGGSPAYEYFLAYEVQSVTDANTFVIDAGQVASSTAGPGGGNVDAIYEINPGNVSRVGVGGYGLGGYGEGAYGEGSTNPDNQARVWMLSNYGENLIANIWSGPIYQWALDLSQPAEIVTNAPLNCNVALVTPERAIFACGCDDLTSTYDPLLIRWSDFADATVWTPAIDNNAGDLRLSDGSIIIAARNTFGGTLVWTDTAVYLIRYVGDPDQIYAADLLGRDCGVAGPNATMEQGGIVYWVSPSGQFFSYSGGRPRVIDNPNRRWYLDNSDGGQAFKIFAFTDPQYAAVTWLFPDRTTGECALYLRLDLNEAAKDPASGWSIGTFDRSCWTPLADPNFPSIAVDLTGNVYNHDVGKSANGGAITRLVEYGYFDLAVAGGSGQNVINVRRATLSATIQGATTLLMTIRTKRWPASEPISKGPYVFTAETLYRDLSIQGRFIGTRLETSGTEDFWRVDDIRIDVNAGPNR